MNQLQIFQNNEFGRIRTLTIDNEPWFVGKDVADGLGYSNSSKAVSVHVDEEDKIKEMIPQSQNGNLVTQVILINESGLYSLILSSKLPSAKRFKRWVTSEVLPSIRKTGQYQVSNFPPKASSIGEIVQLGRFIKSLMKEQHATPYEIAEVVVDTMKQFGISLNDKILLPNRLEKLEDDELDMVEFACTFPNSSYQDYLLYRTMIKASR